MCSQLNLPLVVFMRVCAKCVLRIVGHHTSKKPLCNPFAVMICEIIKPEALAFVQVCRTYVAAVN